MNPQEIISEIALELGRAKDKHPEWPKDMIHQAAVVCEESGEMLQASLQFVYEGKPLSAIKEELIQTGAMVFRMLENFPECDIKAKPPVIEKYKPSNASEGSSFESAFCDRCKKNDDPQGCPVHFACVMTDIDDSDYPDAWICKDGIPECTQFEEIKS